jgi:hypothetical protein
MDKIKAALNPDSPVGEFKPEKNRTILKITGSAYLEEPLKRGERYFAGVEIDCYSSGEERDNNDGSWDEICKASLTGLVTIKDKRGKKIKSKDKRSKSQVLRGALMREFDGGDSRDEFDQYYDIQMGKIIANLPEILEFVKNK